MHLLSRTPTMWTWLRRLPWRDFGVFFFGTGISSYILSFLNVERTKGTPAVIGLWRAVARAFVPVPAALRTKPAAIGPTERLHLQRD